MGLDVEQLIDAKEAGRILKAHPVTVREMAQKGELPAMKIGKVWRFRASMLDEWIRSQIQYPRHQLSPNDER